MLYDDVPVSPQNPLKGDVHNAPKGENLRAPAAVDYSGKEVSPGTLIDVLTGNRSETTPVVLESDEGTDVFVYIAGHGSPGRISFPYGKELTAADFAGLTGQMEREGRYRQIVFMVDACFGESMAVNVTPRGMLYFTGASVSETSLGAVYDMDIRQWLSNEFTQSALSAIRKNNNITFRELYIASYEMVTGSHVRLRNAERFGSIDMPVQEFLRP
jgi:glycosylphosphatidylinositol transamidase (GPIT) subunit GPI8